MTQIRKGDLVQVVTGTDRGKQGRVIEVGPDRVRVERVRMQKRHLKPGRAAARQGGIVDTEGFVHISNVMLLDPADNKPSRMRAADKDGNRGRFFVRSGDAAPDPGEA